MDSKMITAFVFGSLSGLLFIFSRWLKNREKDSPEKQPKFPSEMKLRVRFQQSTDHIKWHRVGYLKEITIFPFKSGAALALDDAEVNYNGVVKDGIYDRSLVCYTEDNPRRLAWAGVYPLMLSIKPSILGKGELQLTAPNMPPLHLDLNEIVTTNQVAKTKFPMITIECGDAANEWVSKVILDQPSGAYLNVGLTPTPTMDGELSHDYSDFMPIMVMHDKSIIDLNSRLARHNMAHHHQFRSNLLISSDSHVPPYDEDKWCWLRIGSHVICRYPKHCRQRILSTIDINTYQENANLEPWKTLKSYRLRGRTKEACLGVYFQVLQPGVVHQGDPVFVAYER